MTYNVFSGTLNPTHSTWPQYTNVTDIGQTAQAMVYDSTGRTVLQTVTQ